MADAGLSTAASDAPEALDAEADVSVESLLPSSAAVALERVHKRFGADVHAVRDVTLDVASGEFVSLLGPSGSGKTTMLMMIAGFQVPTSGRIFAHGKDITSAPPAKRNFGVVFQSYALFPHMTVGRNVGYPLAARRVRRHRRRKLVAEALELVGLQDLGSRRPAELSGGQQQRVALARALVYEPAMLLLDEPLGALDRALRERMQTELRRIHDAVGCSFLYVTHDQEEALTMSDRVVVMQNGRIEQVGKPFEIYSRPVNEFVATFVGTANLIPGTIIGREQDRVRVRLNSGNQVWANGSELQADDGVLLVFRPEQLTLAGSDQPAREDREGLELDGRVGRISFAGSVWRYQVETQAATIDVAASSAIDLQVGDQAKVFSQDREIWAIPARPRRDLPGKESAIHEPQPGKFSKEEEK
jgi:putative spermidine/putrescine transport system ATP-binding protein